MRISPTTPQQPFLTENCVVFLVGDISPRYPTTPTVAWTNIATNFVGANCAHPRYPGNHREQ
nr:MAG TPA: hypothetical protein [Bacteriophage sp.]